MTATAHFVIIEDEDPQWHTWETQETTDVEKTWTIVFSQAPDKDKVSQETVYIKDKEGNSMPLDYGFNETRIKVIPEQDYAPGETYTLFIKGLESREGMLLKENIKMDFKVEAEEEAEEDPENGLTKVDLVVPEDYASPYHIDVVVMNALDGSPVTGLTEADFKIIRGEGEVGIDDIEPGGMDYLDGHYSIYSDLWEHCPEMGHEVRFPVGDYTLEFVKDGYEPARVDFSIEAW